MSAVPPLDRLERVFQEALALASEARSAYLEASCADDPVLRREVAGLLASAEAVEANGFLAEPLVAQGIVPDEVPRLPDLEGETFGPYRLLRLLGRGGMGTVYKASHDGLGRYAALKFLRPHLSADAEMRARFLAEARAAAALDHPNICTVHDVGEDEDGRLFIAMSYYDGETPRAKIARGSLPIGQALAFAVGVAEGLAAAHAVGIVHRDVKPGNVMVTADGAVKLLDFGIAKLEGGFPQENADVRSGTVAYMSPEQARGEEVDHRTDIWSLGVLVYEMLAGRRPFEAAHAQGVLDRILHEAPEPLSSVRPDVPAPLVEIVERALTKDPAGRYADMEAFLVDLRAALREAGEPSGAEPSTVASRPRWGTLGATLAVLVLLAVLSVRPGETDRSGPPPSHQRITSTGTALTPELSPDGQFMAYIEGESETEQRVVVQDLSDDSKTIVLDRCYECWNLRWTPDGSSLAFSALLSPNRPPDTYLVPRAGGALRQLDRYLTFFAWSPDGSRYAGTRGQSIVVVETGGTLGRLDLGVDVHTLRHVDWSPSGDRLLFVTHDEHLRHGLWTVAVAGGRAQKVAEAAADIFTPRWSADGEAIYYLVRQGGSQNLMKVPVDPRSGAGAGSPAAVLTGLSTDDTFSLSADGERLAYARMTVATKLWLLTLARSGAESAPQARPLTTGTGWSSCPSISPDGQTIAFYQATLNDGANVFVMPLEGGSPTQLTHTASMSRCPVWSRDGEMLAFLSNEGGNYRLWTVGAEGGTPQPSPHAHPGNPAQLAWAPGERLVFRPSDEIGLHALDLTSPEPTPSQVDASRTLQRIFSPRYAPDGRRIAVWGWGPRTSGGGLWVLRLDDGSKTLLREGRGVPTTPVGWSQDGAWIYVLEREIGEARLIGVQAATGEMRELIVLPEEISSGLSSAVPQVTVTPDGRQFVFPVRGARVSDVELVENFDSTRR